MKPLYEFFRKTWLFHALKIIKQKNKSLLRVFIVFTLYFCL